MPVPRFRVRTLMAAVVFVAVALGGWIEHERRQRWEEYGERLRHISEQEKENREQADELARRIPEDPDHFKHWSAIYASKAARLAQEKRDLERRIPRLPWEPDPASEDSAGR